MTDLPLHEKHPPGVGLDLLVHTKILGRCPYKKPPGATWQKGTLSHFCLLCNEPAGAHEVENYSTNLRAAWLLVEPYIQSGCAAGVEGDGHTGYMATVTSCGPTGVGVKRVTSQGDSPAHALVLAVLVERGILKED